jgi:hypothetical protein
LLRAFRGPLAPPGYWFDTDSNSKLRIHCSQNSMFSRRVNMRRHAGLNCNWFETSLIPNSSCYSLLGHIGNLVNTRNTVPTLRRRFLVFSDNMQHLQTRWDCACFGKHKANHTRFNSIAGFSKDSCCIGPTNKP